VTDGPSHRADGAVESAAAPAFDVEAYRRAKVRRLERENVLLRAYREQLERTLALVANALAGWDTAIAVEVVAVLELLERAVSEEEEEEEEA
jgi:hypothetical protein